MATCAVCAARSCDTRFPHKARKRDPTMMRRYAAQVATQLDYSKRLENCLLGSNVSDLRISHPQKSFLIQPFRTYYSTNMPRLSSQPDANVQANSLKSAWSNATVFFSAPYDGGTDTGLAALPSGSYASGREKEITPQGDCTFDNVEVMAGRMGVAGVLAVQSCCFAAS